MRVGRRKCGQPGKAERSRQWQGPVPQRLFLICNIHANSWGLRLISPRGLFQVQQQLRVYCENLYDASTAEEEQNGLVRVMFVLDKQETNLMKKHAFWFVVVGLSLQIVSQRKCFFHKLLLVSSHLWEKLLVHVEAWKLYICTKCVIQIPKLLWESSYVDLIPHGSGENPSLYQMF